MASSWKQRSLQGLGGTASVAAAAFVAGLALHATAQVAIRPAIRQPQQQADTVDTAEPKEGVYVNDSLTAKEQLGKAVEKERQKEWNKAADLYQEVLEKYRDRVIPAPVGPDEHARRYTSITNPVQAHLAKWPAAGLDVYRARYETPAATILDSARPGDADTLNRVYSLYFVTDSGKTAGIRLMDLYLERGEFLAAATVGERLLAWHPNLLAERAGVRYRTALAYHLAGAQKQATAQLEQLRKDHASDRGTVRGKDVLLGDSLEAEMRIAPPGATAASADFWPMVGGSPDHSRIPDAAGRPGARIATIPLSKPLWPNLNAQQKQIAESQHKNLADKGGTIGIMQVVDRGELYFQDGQRLYARSLESGMPLAGWSQTYGADGAYSIPNFWGSPRNRQLTLTLTDHVVLAIMGQPDRQSLMLGQPPQGEGRLVCLDRATGKELWAASPSQLPDDAKTQRTLQLTGSPLVVGNNVLVIGRASKQAQFEDCYVLSFDLATGKHRWSCYIASANVSGAMWGMQPMMLAENTSHLAYANGRVYVQTNLGAIAALDAYSGTIAWLDTYPTNIVNLDPNQGGFNPVFQNPQPGVRRKPWSYNPVIVTDGKVFTLPTDGKFLLIYDAQSGVELKRIRVDDLRDKDTNGCDTLLGVSGNKLVVSGELDIICLDWQKYDIDAADRQASWFWLETLPQTIRGRGFVTTDSVFVPSENRLYLLNIANGKTSEAYPPWPRVWEEGEEPGNVLVTSDHVILAGANSVEIYTDLAIARAKLDKEVADAPGDAQPRLRYAEVMFVAGEPDTALQKLDEAIRLIGGAAGMQAGAARNQVFHDALTFAQKLSGDERPEVHERASKLYDRAAAAASSPMQQVHYRMSRARFDEAARQPGLAVKRYQEILSDPQLRTVPLLDEAIAGPAQADSIAEKQITRLKKKDPTVYTPFEAAAVAALKEAKEGKDDIATRLLAVAQSYPNSSVAATALIEAADAYEAAGTPRLAIQAVRQLYFKTPVDSPEKARIDETMARNYLQLTGVTGSVGAAAARLAQQASVNGDLKLQKPLKLPDGRILTDTTFAKALEEVRKYSGREAARTLPDFRLPLPVTAPPPVPGAKRVRRQPFLPPGPQSVVADVKSLVLPVREFSRADRIVAWTGAGGIALFASGQVQPLVSMDGFSDEPRNCAWVGGNMVVWGAAQLALVKADQSKLAWSMDLKQLQSIEVARVGEVAQQVRPNPNANIVVAPNGQVFIRQNGRLGRPGLIQPMQLNLPPQPPRPPAGAAEQIVEVRPVGDRVLVTTSSGRLFSVDLADGKLAWQTRFSERAVDRLCANEDFTVVKVSDDTTVRLVAMDTFTGQVLGSKTFVAQNGLVPVNLALSADGTLVYTLPDRLCLKNLYTSWPDSSDREVQGPAGLPPFSGATQPDQLVVAEGRILALADNGTDKYVRVHSLETGNPIPLKIASPQGDQEVDRVLTAGKNWNVSLRVVGPHLYVVSAEGVTSYNLDRPAETWTSVVPDTHFNVRDMFVGQQFLVLIDDETPAPNGGAPAQPVYGLRAFGLYPASPTNPAESGRLDFKVDVTDPAGLTGSWQAVDGGFCYLSADQKLHLLRGARAEAH